MKHLIQKIIEQIIQKRALISDYPKPGVTFLALDALFNDPESRKIITQAVIAAIENHDFDAVAGIASRGYLFSGIIANHYHEKGESLIQKAKVKGDTHYVQIDTKTEYSTDTLQVLKNSIVKGKKYLLTDDLIATGGSVMTAVQLIRACGGEVDTVFVMTELLAFGAREALKKMGIELISLLPLNTNDLQKLVVMQQCYSLAPAAPMTYALSQQSKGNHVPALTVQVGSLSPFKSQAAALAVQGILDPLSMEVIACDAPSNVNRQPVGYEETMQGAANRMQALVDKDSSETAQVKIAMENGIRYSAKENKYYDFVHVIVTMGELTFSHTEDCCEISEEIIDAMTKDAALNPNETWGEVAKRLGLAQDSNNPQQEVRFGGVSRSEHLLKATCKVLAELKNATVVLDQKEEKKFSINRLVNVNACKNKDRYAKQGIFLASPKRKIVKKAIDLYNHGCPVTEWNIDKNVLKNNEFKVFSTGDAFSIISQEVVINQADVTIHVGIKHETYSPLALLQEALQLCRAAYEHGAGEITVSIPEQFHPVLHDNDFNHLLMNLFKVSGANRLYFYGEHYQGCLNSENMNAKTELTVLSNSQPKPLALNLDEQVMLVTRKNNFDQAWLKSGGSQNELNAASGENQHPAEIIVNSETQQPHILLCCSANKPLAEKVAANLRQQGELVQVLQIEDKGENARIPHAAKICGAIVTIVQSTRPNPDNLQDAQEYLINGASSYFFEAALIARQAQLRGAEKINFINPYQFSARSDKSEDNTRGRTGAYVQHNGMLLKAAGVNQVITAECHDCHTMSGSYTGKNIKGLAVSALSLIATKLASDWLDDVEHPLQGQIRLVTPDAGAAKRTNQLTEQLQAILGKKLCQSRVLGDKQRDSHQDDSAFIKSLNTGNIEINSQDKFLITDDETATGNTLCQSITSLKAKGAKDISVIVVHNNMPLDWLQRQLCLARFLYLGVNDLHFSDTQEMGCLANSYDDLISSYAIKSNSTKHEIEVQVLAWFQKNSGEVSADKSEETVKHNFDRFKQVFSDFKQRIKIHTLAHEFAQQVRTSDHSRQAINGVSDVNQKRYTENAAHLRLFPVNQVSAPTNVAVMQQSNYAEMKQKM